MSTDPHFLAMYLKLLHTSSVRLITADIRASQKSMTYKKETPGKTAGDERAA